MPRALASGICDAVKRDLESGEMDLKTLIARHGISGTKARSMKQRFLTTGEVINTNKKKGSGRKRKLTEQEIESLRLFLNDHPDAFLKEMCRFIEDLYGLRVTESTMQRTCGRIGWKLKKQPRPRDDAGFWIRTLPRDEDGNAIRGISQGAKRPADYGTKLSYTRKRALLEKTREWVKTYMSQPPYDASHDYSHIQRVLALCFQILRVEQKNFRDKSCDGLALELVALMHDIEDHKYTPRPAAGIMENNAMASSSTQHADNGNDDTLMHSVQFPDAIVQSNIDPNLHNASSLALPPEASVSTVEDQLLQLGWPPYITSKVAAMTPFISYTAEKSDPEAFAAALAQYPEIAVVQDADRLDAIGATGIGRAFVFTGAKNREGGMKATLDHFRTKLVELEALMKTGEGRRLAAVRTERLKTYGRWWLEEMCMIDQDVGDMAWVQGPPPALGSVPFHGDLRTTGNLGSVIERSEPPNESVLQPGLPTARTPIQTSQDDNGPQEAT